MALYGIYGRHEIKDCPLNSSESRKKVRKSVESDMSSLLPQYKINKIIGQYHSGLEHTFLWIVDAEDPHLIQKFLIDVGTASFNEVKIVPLMTFNDVISESKKIDSQ